MHWFFYEKPRVWVKYKVLIFCQVRPFWLLQLILKRTSSRILLISSAVNEMRLILLKFWLWFIDMPNVVWTQDLEQNTPKSLHWQIISRLLVYRCSSGHVDHYLVCLLTSCPDVLLWWFDVLVRHPFVLVRGFITIHGLIWQYLFPSSWENAGSFKS